MVYNHFLVKELKEMCKWRDLRYNTKTRKPELIASIRMHDASLKIQRWFRNVSQRHGECPISLEPIQIPFKLKCTVYDAVSLVNFFSISGDFRDPISREPLSNVTIQQLDTLMLKNGIMKPSLSFLKTQNVFEKNQERRNMMLALESQICLCMDKIRDINDLILSQSISRYFHYGLLPQVNDLLLETHDYISQMIHIDSNYTQSMIIDIMSSMKQNTATTSLKLYVLERLHFELCCAV